MGKPIEPTLEELGKLVRYWRSHVNPGCQFCADQLEQLIRSGELPKPLPTKEELRSKYKYP